VNFPWVDTLRDLARYSHLSTRDVLEGQTFAQFVAIWCQSPRTSAGLDMDTLKQQINKRRAALGLPPMKPAPKGKR